MGTFTQNMQYVTETCCVAGCGVSFAMTADFHRERRRDHKSWYCPNGHSQYYSGKSDEEKQRERADAAEAQAIHLNDQLRAAIRDAEFARQQVVHDRERFLNGVCPCCSRYFPQVRAHMETSHPEYDITSIAAKKEGHPVRVDCSCGRDFATFRGLRQHQQRQRQMGGAYRWDKPETEPWMAHLTVVG